jgi:hypothetical protein
MSTDFAKLASELMNGKNNDMLKGKADEIKKIAHSGDGQKVKKMMGNSDDLKKAMEQGDMSAMQKVISDVMSTEEGARLAKQLSELFK